MTFRANLAIFFLGFGVLCASAGWPHPNPPSFIQKDFGPYGSYLPNTGESYCQPTAAAMGLYFLGRNGFTQLAPATFDPGNPKDERQALKFIRALGGLAGTSPATGTPEGQIADAVNAYLELQGISPDQYTFDMIGITTATGPTPSWYAERLAMNTVRRPSKIAFAILDVQAFAELPNKRNVFIPVLGHAVYVAAANPANESLEIYNPYPSAFGEPVPDKPSSNPQTLLLKPVPSGLSLPSIPDSQGYMELKSDSPGMADKRAIAQFGMAWTLDRSAMPSDPRYKIHPLQTDKTFQINTNGSDLDVLAPLVGKGSLEKQGLGTLSLLNGSSLSGPSILRGGTLRSLAATSTPFGSGSIRGVDSSVLSLEPRKATSNRLSVRLAPHGVVEFAEGGMDLRLKKGHLATLETIVGSEPGIWGVRHSLRRSGRANMEIFVDGGIAALGRSIRLRLRDGGARQPLFDRGAVSPVILGIDSLPGNSRRFLSYDDVDGFLAAEVVLGSKMPLHTPSLPAGSLYRADISQTVENTDAFLRGLEISNGARVRGPGTVSLTGTCGAAALILNGGEISAPLDFLKNEAVLAAGKAGGVISSPIKARRGLTKTGEGTVHLKAQNTGLTGDIQVNEGTLLAGERNATGAGRVAVQSGARLLVAPQGTIAGEVVGKNESLISLRGGHLTGGVRIAPRSGADPGSTLEGFGSIWKRARISGEIRPGPRGGVITFRGPARLEGATFFWRLEKLVDDSDSQSQTDWNSLRFEEPAILGTAQAGLKVFVDFAAGIGPDSGHRFWKQPHEWTLFHTIRGMNGNIEPGNFSFLQGEFSIRYDAAEGRCLLTFQPAAALP